MADLPDILRRAMPPDPPQSNANPITIENHNQPTTADDSLGSPPVNVVYESDQSVLVLTPDQVPVTPRVGQPSPPVDHSNTAPVIPQDHAPTPSLSNRRWFNVFPWSSDKESSIAEVKVEMNSAPEDIPDAVRICTELSGNRSKPYSLETIKPADATSAVGDSTPRTDPQSLPKDASSGSPHSASVSQPKFNMVDAPSVREDQPVSQRSPSPLSDYSPVPHTREAIGPPILPNSATGIFAFNFPMLVKSRLPAETAVTSAPRDPSPKPSREPSITTPDPEHTRDAALVAEPTRMASASIVHVSEYGNQSLCQPIALTEARTNTWWTYLGMNGGSSAIQVDPSADNRAQSQPTSSAAPGQPPTSDPTETLQLECEIKAQVNLSPDVSTERSPPNDNKLPSVRNADAAKVPQGSAWYTPWSWYQSSPSSTTTTTVAPDMNSGSQQDPPEHPQVGPKTEERQLTGNHEIRLAPNPVSSSPQDPSAIGTVDYSNPIQSVISANPTGWMTFFTAKAIAMKSITYEKEDRQMEVMEIDDEMVPNPVPSAAPTVTHPSPSQVKKLPVGAQPHTSGIFPPSSQPPMKSDDKRPPVPHAGTYPETVVNDTLKRQPSPSPSKKSGMKIPTSPPPPNLVLPTWHDTFYTLPRSAVPREPPSVLSKTLQYVSGVLFSRSEAPSNKGKGKAKEIIYSPYDKALPRTWDVLEEEAADVLRGCKRVVIIGVHGWFPGGSPP
ncbi:hypothetical protein J3R83DRAFT_11683 [Lanmaoa asiatica]|nr:hypothetical protein J3R83DRAFT_11683 [Lanmaoa asiatica]